MATAYWRNTESFVEGAAAPVVAGRAAAILTVGIGLGVETRSVCGRCRGKGFDRFTKNRSSRRCPRCRGEGSTTVGNTKR